MSVERFYIWGNKMGGPQGSLIFFAIITRLKSHLPLHENLSAIAACSAGEFYDHLT